MTALEHDVVDLLGALQRSVNAARARRTPAAALAAVDERCQRDFRHGRHPYIDDQGNDHDCPGLHSARSYAELLDLRPQLAGIGLASVLHANEVMNA